MSIVLIRSRRPLSLIGLGRTVGQGFLLALAVLLVCLVLQARSAAPARPSASTIVASRSANYFTSGRWQADARSLGYLLKYLVTPDTLPTSDKVVIG